MQRQGFGSESSGGRQASSLLCSGEGSVLFSPHPLQNDTILKLYLDKGQMYIKLNHAIFLNNWIHYQAPCLKFTSVGQFVCWGLCVSQGEGVAIRGSQVLSTKWVPRRELSSAAWKRVPSSLEASCCSPPPPLFFSIPGHFFSLFILLRSFTCFLIISIPRNEGTNSHPLGLCGLGITLLTWAMDHLCSSLGKIALRVILIWVFVLSSRGFFWSTWTFTYVSFSLDDC